MRMKIAAFIFILMNAIAIGGYINSFIRKEKLPWFGVLCSVISIILLTPSLF